MSEGQPGVAPVADDSGLSLYFAAIERYHAYRKRPTKKNRLAWEAAYDLQRRTVDPDILRGLLQKKAARAKRPKKRSLT